jgi:hypothetical protein
VYKQILRRVKLTTGKKGQKTELTGKGQLRRRRSTLDCSATEGPHWTVVPPKVRIGLQCHRRSALDCSATDEEEEDKRNNSSVNGNIFPPPQSK